MIVIATVTSLNVSRVAVSLIGVTLSFKGFGRRQRLAVNINISVIVDVMNTTGIGRSDWHQAQPLARF